MTFFTSEDLKIAFNFFCTVYGIGTLGVPSNFARSGLPFATIALIFMAFANICSCVAISRVMLAAPSNVKTYGDVGEWCCGKIGRYLVVFVQFGVCCLVPCAFLVLGGILLDGISPNAFDQQYWSILMAVMLLPVILTPTLKEGASAAFAGCLGTLLADAISLGILLNGIGSDHPNIIDPEYDLGQVLSSFGNLALAYSAAVLVPALQREHSEPERMPRVVATTMTFTACLFLLIGTTSYISVGCQIPGNLLFAINGTALDLNADRGAVVLAYMFMQLHITIAFSVILNPVLYIAERGILGMHQPSPSRQIDEESPAFINTINSLSHPKERPSNVSAEYQMSPQDLIDEYQNCGPIMIAKYTILRIIIVVILLIIAIIFKDHFVDFTDFVGAWAVSMACIILPIFFYLKAFWNFIPLYEKILGSLLILVCAGLGCYVTYTTGEKLFLNIVSDKTFQYCPSGYDMVVYTNATFYGNT
ncbi:amino acid auxin permease family [Plasmopara halstedii]|uniref:Amino acid auxin permease family n=1 Tax=Plasmopara halstedii TaxID=4781 RepID=A0A0P1ALL4_PLAHL|nr:amino acid auxin permease family [Plasmopara halstedii]CEG41620.1 amino acid auxin permease family [Plasmopara halstedii]|eukprot:XP_024577989.1 amino acid auxin permease family [Plasmopara halstedii]